MAQTVETTLPSQTPGVVHKLCKHTFGGSLGQRSAYIQAGLHADEHPGLLVIQHLLVHLQKLEQQGRIFGRIVIRPFANPVGMGQQVFGQLTGRFNLANGENFNRNFPNIVDKLETVLTTTRPAHNDTSAMKALMLSVLGDSIPTETVAANKYLLLHEALQHDLFIDLHCDTSSILHIYANLNQQERATRLATCMGVTAVFLEEEAGGFPLDEAYAKAWKTLYVKEFVDKEHLGFSATVELRGQADVEDDIAEQDAMGLLRFLCAEGLIRLDDDTEHPIRPEQVTIYPLEGVAHLEATGTGIIAWKKALGSAVQRGEIIAEILPLDMQLGTSRIPVLSPVDGALIARHHIRLARAGQRIGMAAGTEPLPGRITGQLMHAF
ncbi:MULTISPECIES: succinylglutamate desuccinylase/aspartoacylase family protein [Pseudomonas]|uniref:Succinylglutamate desuccinylase n=1 Tax=Pseudomonas frederiksbergensis TaxID=104087 RepID=A0A2S8H4J2_9PSED|nr:MULTISPECIES: succinylglutamate desuccinylase/aspartoacylase family protein [Pseudomonas]MDR8364188.1 M14 family metallopeptidase [Pseudomonas sp. JL3]PQO96400.1 succinylglutamate desuccinylase [Pseudomonas frederiksbergensis]UVM36114.1 M14 family metallopeptidase [Pseudomonas sp. B21-017]WLG92444.1 M14 family metallopeptidase [Pseudomonas cucumis]